MIHFALFTGGMPGFWEILILLFVILLLFGARRLPELARSLGKSLGEFKKGRKEGELPTSADTAPGTEDTDVGASGDKQDR